MKSDWKIYFTLDRKALEAEIARLQGWLDKPWQDIYCIVDAESEEEALLVGTSFKQRIAGLPILFVKNKRARRLP